MRPLLLALTLFLASTNFAAADPLTGVHGFEYRAYRYTPPQDIANLRTGANSQLSCDDVGFFINYDIVWDAMKNIVDSVVANKKALLLGALQYLLAKVSPTLYSVLSKLNSLAEMALKYNFDACALYKKAQKVATENSSAEGLSGLCMSIVGDPEVCSAPGKALKAVFGKDQVDVVSEVIKDPGVADLVKSVIGTIVFTSGGSSLTTSYYAPAWHLADVYSGFFIYYYNKYAEIAERVHSESLNEDSYYKEYAPWITVGGEVDLKKATKLDVPPYIDLSGAKFGGYQIPYEFFYYVARFTPEVASTYIQKLAQYAAAIDLQAFMAAVEKAITAGSGATGKGGVLKDPVLAGRIETAYREFAAFSSASRENIVELQNSARKRYAQIVASAVSQPPPRAKRYLTDLLEGPELK